jgi:hypothetical protein
MNNNHNTSIFINLSNHPSSGWSEEQQQAARRLGDIVDLQFPPVDPEMTTGQVKVMADELVAAILEYGKPTDLTVHVMGEMTLTYSIVAALSQQGVRCVASTTERIVTEVDGKRVSEFHFVQFREYSS